MELSASLEDYIEAIYHIVEEKQVARAKNIAELMGVSRASVTEALRALSSKGLINYAPYEVITMTDTGRLVAEDVIFRHTTLKKFFIEILTIDKDIAEEGACKVEHAAPPEVIGRMIDFMKFVDSCPQIEKGLINKFREFCNSKDTNKVHIKDHIQPEF
jgi:DtxR family Mn-dependent transcriptional regulator